MAIIRQDVVNEILKHIETNITTGVWKPGGQIDSEIKMSAELNVSRASIHSAIQRLVALGVLESHQGKGTFVKSIQISEIQNRLNSITRSVTLRKLMEFRIILEGEICGNIAAHISENTVKEMTACLEGMIKCKNDPKKLSHYDMQFHRILVLATQNDIIIRSLDIICDEIERQNVLTSTNEGIDTAIKYHQRIINCLSNGDGEGASKAMIEHLQLTPCNPPFNIGSTKPTLFSLK